MSPTTATPPSAGARQTRDVAVAGVVVAVVGIAIQLITAHSLTQAENTQFLAFWAALYLVIGITVGIQTETTRSVRAALHSTGPQAHRVRGSQDRGVLVVRTAIMIGLMTAGVVVVPVGVWADHVIPGHAVLVAALIAFAALGFAGHAAVTGALAGQGEWAVYARVTGLEAAVRIVLVALVAVVAATLGNFIIASAVATAAWLIPLTMSRRTRATLQVRGDRPLRQHLTGVWHAILASSSTAVIVVGFPVLLSLTTPAAEYGHSAPLLLALSLTRAPLLLPLNVFQGIVITHLVSNPHRRGAVLSRVVAAVAVVGLAGAGLAYVLGPPIMRLFTYEMSGGLLAALTGAGAVLALLTLCGTAVLAAGLHRAYSFGWVLATIVSVAVLLLPWGLETRTVASLMVGPAAGIVVHVTALIRQRPRAATASAPVPT